MILYNCQEGNRMAITRKGERGTDGRYGKSYSKSANRMAQGTRAHK